MPTAVEDQTLFNTWPTWTWSHLFLVLAVYFSGSHAHLRVFGHGHRPQTLLLLDLPRCLPPCQRYPDIYQNEHLLIICWPLQVNHHDWLTSRGTRTVPPQHTQLRPKSFCLHSAFEFTKITQLKVKIKVYKCFPLKSICLKKWMFCSVSDHLVICIYFHHNIFSLI